MKLLAGVCAASVIAFSAPAMAQNVGDSLFDGACVALKHKFNGNPLNQRGGIGDVIFNKTIDSGTDIFKNSSVICSIDDPRVMLVTTVDFINRTALSAAQGMSSIEKALGLKNETAVYVAQLEAVLQGGDPTQQIDNERLKVTERLGARAKAIRAELDKKESENYLTPEARELVIAAQGDLSRAAYFLSQSATGASSFGLMFSKMTPDQQLSFSLPGSTDEQSVSNSFLVSAPSRVLDMGNNLRNVVSLGGKVEDSLSPKDIDEMRKQIKGERKKSAKQAKKDAKAVAAKYEGQIEDSPYASMYSGAN